MELNVDYLNHASVLLSLGEFKLLCDPWFSGTAFAGGWGLRYENPKALSVASRATHLWISHWHSDHMHVPTLKALLANNPELHILANCSANFSFGKRVRDLGFRRVTDVMEREPLAISPGISVTRYPTAGIDNMLHIHAPGWSILNYNDCNMPATAVKSLHEKIGGIDLLLTNYNHAGKLFERAQPDQEKQQLWDALVRVVDGHAPTRVIPFASSHYYRVAASQSQNRSLLGFDDLEQRAAGDARFCVLRIGDRVTFQSARSQPHYERMQPRLDQQPEQTHDYGASIAWDELERIADERCAQLRHGFPLSARFVKPLRIEVSDIGRVLELDIDNGAREAEPRAGAHIAAHSRAIQDWLGRMYGDDSFVAGAHFDIRSAELPLIKRWVALSLLYASQLSLRNAWSYLQTREGRRFFWSRREELVSMLKVGRLRAGEMRA